MYKGSWVVTETVGCNGFNQNEIKIKTQLPAAPALLVVGITVGATLNQQTCEVMSLSVSAAINYDGWNLQRKVTSWVIKTN